jgi:very-short-patch-repair endonuclease
MASQHEQYFERLCEMYDIPEYEREYRFNEPRSKHRFDFAWPEPERKVAVEIDGGQYKPRGGRHARDSDRIKLNLAVVHGWRVLRFSGEMLADDPEGCMAIVREVLG